MALKPIDRKHALQILAGTIGRKKGHKFENEIAVQINKQSYPFTVKYPGDGHVFMGCPSDILLKYIGIREKIKTIVSASAVSTGALATSENGKKWLLINGINVSRCKSDLILTIASDDARNLTVGITVKQCSHKRPTNAQLYFTTAQGFINLLSRNGLKVSNDSIAAMRQFCGDSGFCPQDNHKTLQGRLTDPRRFFWEEINQKGRKEWENIFTTEQDKISRLLFQYAYENDPFIPEYLLHQTKCPNSLMNVEMAIYSIDELVFLSRAYQGFVTKPYAVKKGSYKDPAGVTHLAPRFGIIQMQRGGQKQHPTQLQFNLEAGYFYKI